jgi:hypothetical protein
VPAAGGVAERVERAVRVDHRLVGAQEDRAGGAERAGTWPAAITPAPIAAQALSPPPATTGTLSGKPQAAAASAVTRPVTSTPSNTGGSHVAGTSSAASISSL